MRPANCALTQSNLNRLGAAMRNLPSIKSIGVNGLIQALNCCGVSSCSNCAAHASQKFSINYVV